MIQMIQTQKILKENFALVEFLFNIKAINFHLLFILIYKIFDKI